MIRINNIKMPVKHSENNLKKNSFQTLQNQRK